MRLSPATQRERDRMTWYTQGCRYPLYAREFRH